MDLLLQIMLILTTILILGAGQLFWTLMDANRRLTRAGRFYVGWLVIAAAVNIAIAVREDDSEYQRDILLADVREALNKKGLEYDSATKEITINTQGLTINTVGPVLTEQKKREILERVAVMLRENNLSCVEVVLSQGSNAAEIALQMEKELKNEGYQVEPVGAIINGPWPGVEVLLSEDCVRVAVGVL